MHNLKKIRLFRILLWVVYPFACLFILPFSLFRRKNPQNLFFFFDRYCIGGAQRVHIDILNSVSDIHKQVYFTRYSPNDKLKHEFYSIPNSENRDIHFWCDNILLRIFSVHYFAFYINRHPDAILLSSNSTFFYDMLPFLNMKIKKIELLHNFSYGKKGMEFFGLANCKYLDYRMVIDIKTKAEIIQQYQNYGIDKKYFERIKLVEAGTDILDSLPEKDNNVINVLYAGRGGLQKRVWLINKIVELVLRQTNNIRFHFAGPLDRELSDYVKTVSIVYGEVGEKAEMKKIYSTAHVVLLTSSFEGFPMVIKEGMANGAVPVVTALEGNKSHLTHLKNAMLIESIEDEDACVKEAVEYLIQLSADKNLLSKLSMAAFEYASSKFSRKNFMNEYRTLLTQS